MSHSVNSEKYHYGIDAELQEKIGARWNQEDANTALAWIGKLSGMDLGTDFHAGLKDGVALCKAMNAIKAGSIPRVNTMKMPFMMRENIVAFLEACKSYGMKPTDVFVTQDLFEGDNLVSVVDCIFALAGVAQSKNFTGSVIGVKNGAKLGGEKKFTVAASGGTGLTRQNIGSYGYQDESRNRSLDRQIIKTTEKASSEPSKMNSHNPGLDTSTTRMDKIIRNADEFESNKRFVKN